MNPSVVSGLIITLAIHGSVAAGLVAFTGWGQGDEGDERPPMIAIEASLAYKSPEKQPRQPQKRRAPRPTAEPTETKISRDETRKPEPQKEKEEEDFAKQFEDLKRQRQAAEEELEEGPAEPQQGGEFNGSERGFAEVSKGDPYMQELAGLVFAAWEVPSLETGEGTAIGCVRLGADGSIVDTRLWQETKNANIDRSVKLALRGAQEQRKPGEAPVPRHLLDATTRWTCFNFSVKPQ